MAKHFVEQSNLPGFWQQCKTAGCCIIAPWKTNDEFFAEASNLVKPGRGIFDPDRYTDRGKWMDGWESRRKRGPGYDWCILRLGVPGVIRGLDIDTNHFLGNHPPFASVEGCLLPMDTDVDTLLAHDDWDALVKKIALDPGSQHHIDMIRKWE